ncbi:ABC transporter substrate-binding protein [Acidisoma cellulosilytica]|uniref:ABC transporter substrate-binding protein n=1 Tax=Acidisoma cellulosilyticum TaxID=2802395 RepID=A0A963Z0S0_9PROT|nr:ABC transporter substrate-binding protein [Acidisoma cellulosilyticum]MCB8879725.1 ABC transporter substrate-binding protein [Acidisoma cellulosilyticum]
MVTCFGLTRRSLLAGAAGAGLASGKAVAAVADPRLVVLDWGLLETVLALGIAPIAAAETGNYARAAATLPVPPSVTDIGLRLDPDLEWIHVLRPGAILINAAQSAQISVLKPLAPIWTFSIYDGSGEPLRNAETVTRDLGARIGRRAEAAALVASTMHNLRPLPGYDSRPLLLFSFLDATHIALYDRSSLAGNVLDRLGLDNAWTQASGGWGVVPLSLPALAQSPEARLICFGPVPLSAQSMMAQSPLWRDLPAIRAGRIRLLPPVWNYGALPTAARIADLIRTALARADGQDVIG